MSIDSLHQPSRRFVLFTGHPVLRRQRGASVLKQHLLSGVLQGPLGLPLITSDENGNDSDNDIQGVP